MQPADARVFSTTPNRWDDIDDRSDSTPPRPAPPPTRSAAAVSSLNSLPQSSPQSTDARQFAFRHVTPGDNIISMKSLPRRGDGAPRPQFARRGEDGGARGARGDNNGPPRFVRMPGAAPGSGPRPGEAGFVPRFAHRVSPGAPRGGGGYRGASGGRGRGGGGARGRGRGRGGGSARGRARRQREKSDKEKEKEKLASDKGSDAKSLGPEVQEYIKTTAEGADVPYTPSLTLDSLIGYGPAVATNTSLGAVETAMRSMRLLGGGRSFAATELTFQMSELERPLHGGKPIFYSSLQQKMSARKDLERKYSKDTDDAKVDRVLRRTLRTIKKTNKNDANALNAALQKFEDNKEEEIKRIRNAIEKQERTRTTHWKTPKDSTKKAILQFAVQGKHAAPKYAGSDVLKRLSMYHAHGSTYRAGDGQKFDDKAKALLASTVKSDAARAAPAST